ncbi:uncharacterized protein [Cicer arietinum]|uniref:Uncharacterized protein LOC101493581 n=1 Tax=Cicer arietinum TaxID=3827 RepID=A0A1S2YTV1_CICAR|nr:uncharacterized protein LOC101493581 [Cicer arietinum]
MEIETNHKQKLEVSDILKEAFMIFVKNLNFIIFTFVTSLPLFCIMVYFEIQLQETLVETLNIINPKHNHFRDFGYMLDLMNTAYFLKLIQLGIIYMVPLHVLEFCTAIVTIDLASMISLKEKKMTLKEMFQKPFEPSKLRGSFLTFIYVLFLTTTHQLGLLWIVINYHFFLKGLSYVLFGVICSMLFAKVLKMYLEWSSMWNMSFVISILEGIYGIDALALSVNFSKGCHEKGLFLMLIFFAWEHFLRLSCYLIGGYYEQGNGIFIQVGLMCIVIPLKWVVFMIYFNDCKEKQLEKKMDEELGKDVKVVSE